MDVPYQNQNNHIYLIHEATLKIIYCSWLWDIAGIISWNFKEKKGASVSVNLFREYRFRHTVLSSVIRQIGESQNGCYKKTKHVKFYEKRTFLTPWYVHIRNLTVNIQDSIKIAMNWLLKWKEQTSALLSLSWK